MPDGVNLNGLRSRRVWLLCGGLDGRRQATYVSHTLGAQQLVNLPVSLLCPCPIPRSCRQ